MIASLTGTVTQLAATAAVVEVGGFGVLAHCSPHTAAGLRLGQSATLATALVVREDSLTLYGFGTGEERDFFELLLTATGVGPKLAQAALAVLSPDELRRALVTENLVQLMKVPGVGRKGAQRMVLELKDKVNAVAPVSSSAALSATGSGWRDQVAQGLEGLGWSSRDAESACAEVEHLVDEDSQVSVAVLMRAALQSLAR